MNTPNQKDCHRKLLQGGKVVLDTVASTDAYGRRVVPQSERNLRSDRFLAFLGDSFTFGDGVADSESYPAQLARETKGRAVYNYAVSGYGPNNVLESLETRDLRQEIPQRKGTFIYLWISDHAVRVYGALSHRFADNYPQFELNSEGKLALTGSFRQTQPIRYRFYDLLRNWRLGERLGFDLPPRITDGDFPKVNAILRAIADRTRDQFPESDFYLLIWPENGALAARSRASLHTAFDGSPIHVVDLQPYSGPSLPDGHPSGVIYSQIADQVIKILDHASNSSHH